MNAVSLASPALASAATTVPLARSSDLGVPRIVIWVGVAVIVLIVGGIIRLARKRRLRGEAGFALEHGWQPVPSADLATRWAVPPFNAGERRESRLTLAKRVGDTTVTLGELATSTTARGQSVVVPWTFIALSRPGVPFPSTAFVSERLRKATRQEVGQTDFALGDPDFDAKRWVKSESPQFAFDLLQGRLREVLLTEPTAKSHVYLLGGDLIVARRGAYHRESLMGLLEEALAVSQAIPDHAWERLGMRPFDAAALWQGVLGGGTAAELWPQSQRPQSQPPQPQRPQATGGTAR